MTATALTDFLLARIADDEAHVNGWCEDYVPCGQREHPGHRSEARTRAECEAKRRIVEEFFDAESTRSSTDINDFAMVVRVLAAVYADHRDYRPEWKP